MAVYRVHVWGEVVEVVEGVDDGSCFFHQVHAVFTSAVDYHTRLGRAVAWAQDQMGGRQPEVVVKHPPIGEVKA